MTALAKFASVMVTIAMIATPAIATASDNHRIFMEVDGTDSNKYFSRVITLPFPAHVITYERDGQQALAAAKQQFVNNIYSRFRDKASVNDVHVYHLDHESPSEFEALRLQKMQSKKDIVGVSVHSW